MSYIPTPGPLPGEQWKPSNGTVGYSFVSDFCGNCARDVDEDCPILAASFRGEAVEWRLLPDGEIGCISFVRIGDPMPAPRDTKTVDMFAGQEGGAAT